MLLRTPGEPGAGGTVRSLVDTARWPRTVAAVFGVGAALGGLAVVAGWIFRLWPLVRTAGAQGAVPFNTGLGLLLGGLALVLVALGRPWAALPAAALTFLLGALTLAEIVLGLEPGLDLVFQGGAAVGGPVRGRMALATALSLMLHGAGVTRLLWRRSRRTGALGAALLGSVSTVLGAGGLIAFATGIDPAYGWGRAMQMSPRTAAALVALGVGLLLAAWAREALPRGHLPAWLAPLVGVDTLALTLTLWWAASGEQQLLLTHAASHETTGLATELSSELQSRGHILERMARRWSAMGRPPREEWETEAMLLLGNIESSRSLAWYDREGVLRWHVGRIVDGQDVADRPGVREAMAAAADVRHVVTSDAFDAGERSPAFALVASVTSDGAPDGSLLWVFRSEPFIGEELERDVTLGYGVRVEDHHGRVLFEHDAGELARVSAPIQTFDVPGSTWSVQAWPAGMVRPLIRSDLPAAFLVGGSLFAVLIGLAIALGGRSARAAAELRREAHERERIQEALESSEALFRGVFDHAAVGIARTDLKGLVLGCNGACAEAFGRPPEALFGRELASLLHPEDAARARELSEELLAGERDRYVLEARVRRDDDRVFWGRLTASLVQDGRGGPLWGVVMVEDVTERRRAERQLRMVNRRLAERNADLERFASVVAHDLQEPLLTVRMFAEHLAEGHAEGLDPEGRDFLDRIRRAAAHMQGLIDSLLALTRVATRGAPFTRVDLGVVASEVVADLTGRIEAAGGEVVLEELPVLEADGAQLHQLFQNLVSNALKFHREGVSPRVRIASRPVRFEDGSEGYELTVADNGLGFEAPDLEHLFEPFQRLHVGAGFEGTGIGLTICRRIVQRHGGTIRAESEPGRGTTFVIRLPAVPSGRGAVERARRPRA